MMDKLLSVLCALALFTSQTFAQVGVPFPGPGSKSYKIATPVSLGSTVGTSGGGTTVTLATTAAIPVNSTVVVFICFAKASTISISSVSDGTNAYASAVTAAWDSSTFVGGAIYYISNANAVSSGASLTATFSSSTLDPVYIAAYYINNITISSPLDKTNSASSGGTPSSSVSSGSTTTLAQANEIAFGMTCGYTTPAVATTPTESSGFTNLTFVNNGGSTRYFINGAYQIVSATTALTYQATFTAPYVGPSMIATFKGL